MILNKKNIIDKPRWRNISSMAALNVSATPGQYIDQDHRNRRYADPYRYTLNGLTTMYRYNTVTDGWTDLISPAMAGTYGRGATQAFVPSQGPRGTLAAGATTTKIIISTALPAAVGINQLANRGDNLGYIVRIIGSAAGSSGKIEERRVVSNTSGTTPTIYLDQPLSFTPANGDRYEFLAGRVYFLTTGAPTAGQWKYYDILTASMSGNLATANLPTISVIQNEIVALDEAHIPHSRFPGEGFVVGASTYDVATTAEDFTKKCLLATGSAAGTLTGQAASGDANVFVDEFRNFQIRIVEDTAIPTAVGQRGRIASHTVGASPVYTMASNWSVTPSTNCKFVIENDNDKLIFFNSSSTVIYNYNHTANTWDTSTWAARSVAMVVGFAYQHFGLDIEGNRASGLDPDKNQRNSFIASTRGASGAVYDVFDIAGAATGSWSSSTIPEINISLFLQNSSTVYSQWCYDNISNDGRYVYILQPAGAASASVLLRFDLISRKISPYAHFPVLGGIAGGGAQTTPGNRAMFYISYDKYIPMTFVAFARISNANPDFFEMMII